MILDQEWRLRAACKGMDTRMFFPTTGLRAPVEALAACDGCPVRVQCGDHALVYEDHGTWAGMNESDRRRKRKRLNLRVKNVDPEPKRPKCGTQAGYRAHLRRGEDACQPCMEANARVKTPYPSWPGDPRGFDETITSTQDVFQTSFF